MTEYLLWGLRAGVTEDWREELLATRLPNRAAAERVIEIAEAEGFHSFRIAKFTEGEMPNFAKTVRI
jgi:hypothetical protein